MGLVHIQWVPQYHLGLWMVVLTARSDFLCEKATGKCIGFSYLYNLCVGLLINNHRLDHETTALSSSHHRTDIFDKLTPPSSQMNHISKLISSLFIQHHKLSWWYESCATVHSFWISRAIISSLYPQLRLSQLIGQCSEEFIQNDLVTGVPIWLFSS